MLCQIKAKPVAVGTAHGLQNDRLSGAINSANSPAGSSKQGRRSRDKGARTERALMRFLQEHGFAAQKVSGMYVPGPDPLVPLLGIDRRVEVKRRAAGFRQVYTWLAERDLLIIKADRSERLVILPLRLAVEIATVAEQKRGAQ
jgi:hypothetical protein